MLKAGGNAFLNVREKALLFSDDKPPDEADYRSVDNSQRRDQFGKLVPKRVVQAAPAGAPPPANQPREMPVLSAMQPSSIRDSAAQRSPGSGSTLAARTKKDGTSATGPAPSKGSDIFGSHVYISREMQLVEETMHFVQRAASSKIDQAAIDAYVAYLAVMVRSGKLLKIVVRWRKVRVLIKMMQLAESAERELANEEDIDNGILDKEIAKQFDLDHCLYLAAERVFWEGEQDRGVSSSQQKIVSGSGIGSSATAFYPYEGDSPSSVATTVPGNTFASLKQSYSPPYKPPSSESSKYNKARTMNTGIAIHSSHNWETLLTVLKFMAILLPNSALMRTSTLDELADLPPDHGAYWSAPSLQLLNAEESAALGRNVWFQRLTAIVDNKQTSEDSAPTADELNQLSIARDQMLRVEKELQVLNLICKMRQGDDGAFHRLGELPLSEPRHLNSSEIMGAILQPGTQVGDGAEQRVQEAAARDRQAQKGASAEAKAFMQEKQGELEKAQELRAQKQDAEKRTKVGLLPIPVQNKQRNAITRTGGSALSTVNAGRLRTYLHCVNQTIMKAKRRQHAGAGNAGGILTQEDVDAMHYLDSLGHSIDPGHAISMHKDHLDPQSHSEYRQGVTDNRWRKFCNFADFVGRAHVGLKSHHDGAFDGNVNNALSPSRLSSIHAQHTASTMNKAGMFPLAEKHSPSKKLLSGARDSHVAAKVPSAEKDADEGLGFFGTIANWFGGGGDDKEKSMRSDYSAAGRTGPASQQLISGASRAGEPDPKLPFDEIENLRRLPPRKPPNHPKFKDAEYWWEGPMEDEEDPWEYMRQMCAVQWLAHHTHEEEELFNPGEDVDKVTYRVATHGESKGADPFAALLGGGAPPVSVVHSTRPVSSDDDWGPQDTAGGGGGWLTELGHEHDVPDDEVFRGEAKIAKDFHDENSDAPGLGLDDFLGGSLGPMPSMSMAPPAKGKGKKGPAFGKGKKM
eukprot:g12680.t1